MLIIILSIGRTKSLKFWMYLHVTQSEEDKTKNKIDGTNDSTPLINYHNYRVSSYVEFLMVDPEWYRFQINTLRIQAN